MDCCCNSFRRFCAAMSNSLCSYVKLENLPFLGSVVGSWNNVSCIHVWTETTWPGLYGNSGPPKGSIRNTITTAHSPTNLQWRKNGLAAVCLFQGHHIFTIKLLMAMLLCALSNSMCSYVKLENLPIWVSFLGLGIMFLMKMWWPGKRLDKMSIYSRTPCFMHRKLYSLLQ